MLFTKLFRRGAIAVAAFLAIQVQAQPERGAFHSLSGRDQDLFIQRFGPAAEPAAEIENALRGRKSIVDREPLNRAIKKLSTIDPKAQEGAELQKLARAWQLAAELTRRLDGPTDEMLSQLEQAYLLNPDDAELKRQVLFERQRKRLAMARVAEAERIRKARDRGEDPFDGLAEVVELVAAEDLSNTARAR